MEVKLFLNHGIHNDSSTDIVVCVSILNYSFLFRVLNMEELPWTEEEEDSAEHPYYNNIPGKMPPPGGFIDTRLTNQNATSDGCQVQIHLSGLISDKTKE